MKKINLLVYALFFINICLFGQTASEVLEKVNKEYTGSKEIQFKTQYSLFKDYETDKIEQQYTGFFYKTTTNEMYMKINKTEFIKSKKIALKINHEQKALEICKLQEFKKDFDVNLLRAYCTISSFKKITNYWEIVLTPKELSGLSYSKIVLHIGENYLFKKQIFYINTGMDFSNDYRKQNLSYPRLEILFNPTNTLKPTLINTSSIIAINKDKINGIGDYKNYEILDFRKNTLN